MKLEDVMDAAQRWATLRECGTHVDAMQALGYFRTAIHQYGRAQRERAAKVCAKESVVLSTRDMTRGALHCASAIRSLPDEEAA